MSDNKEIEKLTCKHTGLPAIKCWACGEVLTLHSRAENDGFCHYCGSEMDLDTKGYGMSDINEITAFRICLIKESQINETGGTLIGDINEHFANMKATHVEVDGQVLEASIRYCNEGEPLVFIGLDVTENYREHLKVNACKKPT